MFIILYGFRFIENSNYKNLIYTYLIFNDISDDSMVTTIKELNENYPYINWKMYFTNRFGKYNIRYNIDDNTKILNKTPTCFKNLGTLFQKKNYDALFDVAEL